MKFLFSTAVLAAAFVSFNSAHAQNANPQNSATQLVLKHDFERNDSVGLWRQQTPKDAKVNALTLDTSGAHAGNSALKYEIVNAEDAERYIFSGVNLPPNPDGAERSLRIRVWARTAPNGETGTNFTFRVLERDESKVTGWLGGKNDAIRFEPSADWKEFVATGQLKAATRGLTIYVVALKPQVGQSVWIDDLSVEVVPTLAP
jgi:hypothetical protein